MIWQTEQGFTTIEIMIALVIIVLIITVTMIIIFGGQQSAVDADIAQDVLYKVQNLEEESRAESKHEWNSLVSNTISAGDFTEEIKVIDVDEYVKMLKSKVTRAINTKVYASELSTLLTNWDEMANQGNCPNESSSQWSSPYILQTVDLSPTLEVTGVDVKDGFAYVTADGDGSLFDFFVINTNIDPPSIIKKLDTGPGLLAVHVFGNYAYVLNTSTSSQLQVIDLNNYSVANYKLPGSTSGSTSSLYYYDKKIYIGTPTSSNSEFHVVDVSDPGYIHEVGNFELGLKINGIYVSNGYAFITTPDNAEELKILDVHDPAHIKLLPGFDAPGSSGNGKSLARKSNKLFLGRTVGNVELYVLDINNIGGGGITSQNIDSSINGMSTIGSLVFLATNDSTKEFQVWRLLDDASSLVLQSILDLPSKATSIDCENEKIYVTTDTSNNGLLILSGS